VPPEPVISITRPSLIHPQALSCRARREATNRVPVQTDERPLPESLTRYLGASSADVSEPVPRPAERRIGPAEQGSTHRALEALLLRGFVYLTSGLVWLLVVGLVLRHLAR